MATHPRPERDPVDEEVQRILDEDPGLLPRLQDYDRRRRRGELDLVDHDEALRRLGLDHPAE